MDKICQLGGKLGSKCSQILPDVCLLQLLKKSRRLLLISIPPLRPPNPDDPVSHLTG